VRAWYNARIMMTVDPGDLSDILTQQQMIRLGRLLRQLMTLGHGELSIRVVRGEPKIIRVELEELFDPYKEGSRMVMVK
jgi:hypothetical protein